MVIDVEVVKAHIKPKADSTLRNMRKDDLIEYIRLLEHNHNVAVSFNEQQAQNFLKLCEDCGTKAGTKWIGVKEKSPKCGERVLATDGVFVGEAYRTSADSWYRQTGFPWRGALGTVVTHWMPLPEPPKEG